MFVIDLMGDSDIVETKDEDADVSTSEEDMTKLREEFMRRAPVPQLIPIV